ncbi:MAG: TIGR00295 family protein [Thermoplasmata archaeon]
MSTKERSQDDPKARRRLPTKDEALEMLKSAGADASVVRHCIAVSTIAVKIAKRCTRPVDIELVEVGGLLHDIGRISTHGIRHAVEGARIASEKGLPEELVRIIERHIGAGLTEKDAERLGLPRKSYMPETLEEKIVAHADNLISGTKKVPVAETVQRLVRMHEMDGAKRMVALHKELSEACGVDLDLL